MIRFYCDCGNDDSQQGFDTYVSHIELCDELTIICRQCASMRIELVAYYEDSVTFFDGHIFDDHS